MGTDAPMGTTAARRVTPLWLPSLSHNSHRPSYNPRADKSDYNSNETLDIADLYGEEVYNNIHHGRRILKRS